MCQLWRELIMTPSSPGVTSFLQPRHGRVGITLGGRQPNVANDDGPLEPVGTSRDSPSVRRNRPSVRVFTMPRFTLSKFLYSHFTILITMTSRVLLLRQNGCMQHHVQCNIILTMLGSNDRSRSTMSTTSIRCRRRRIVTKQTRTSLLPATRTIIIIQLEGMVSPEVAAPNGL